MIFLGYRDDEKRLEIEQYKAAHGIRKVVVISADGFRLPVPGADRVDYSDTIEYVTFYRLLQEIDRQTLVVLNECLRTQNRYDLTYNCIRHFLSQTQHQLIFQQLPQIDTREDFMILFDFDTQSRWKRLKFDLNLVLDNTQVCANPLPLLFKRVEVPTSDQTRQKYTCEKTKRFETLGKKDPHTIARNLYLIGGKDKLAYIGGNVPSRQLSLFDTASQRQYVARNSRLGNNTIVSYDQVAPSGGPYTILELPHRFIDFSDFIKTTWQTRFDVLVADLKVDEWYFNRYLEWKDRIHETYTDLQQQ